MNSSFPDGDDGLRLHLRHLSLDATAAADICAAYLPPLVEWLAGRFPWVDEDAPVMAAADALMEYLQGPGRFDCRRGDLGLYLRVAAGRDLKNLRRAEARHGKRKSSENSVELAGRAGNLCVSEDDPVVRLERHEAAAAARAGVARLRAALTPEEGRVLDLMLDGHRDLDTFASALGVAERTLSEQREEVKRVKDRIKKRLQRGGLPWTP